MLSETKLLELIALARKQQEARTPKFTLRQLGVDDTPLAEQAAAPEQGKPEHAQIMSPTVQRLLASFEALTEVEKQQVVVEVLRRAGRLPAETLSC